MEYHEAASFLFDLRRYSASTGLASTRRLLEYLDRPDADLRVVQVAGSNGKGSTARMLDGILRAAGYSVGLYTSPHLDDLRERVRIDGRKVRKRTVCEFVETAEPHVTERAAAGDSPTFFETTTALAAWAFAEADVDVAVLEVGIGGRYDATSALDVEAAAVTSVTLEHADLLGDTIPEIARDKAAVAPADRPLVTATTGTALETLADVADVYRVGTADDQADDAGEEAVPPMDLRVEDRGRDGLEQALTLHGDGWTVETAVPLLGSYQVRNAGVAAALARQVADPTTGDVARGLRNAHWPGRFEVVERSPLVVLDGAHNPGSCEGLAETLSTFDYDRLHLVFGAMSDKDVTGMAAALPTPDHVHTCRPAFDRAETPAVLAEVFEAAAAGAAPDDATAAEAAVDDATADDAASDDTRSVTAHGAVADAVDAAVSAADDGDAVLVCGSLFVVAEARRRWTRLRVPKQVPDVAAAEAVLDAAGVTEGGVRRMRGKGVHRVVATRVLPRQAEYLKQELLAIGGECATSGLDAQPREPVDVVLMGTLTQFRRLLAALDDQPFGLAPFGEELRETLGLRGPTDTARDGTGDATDEPAYPWTEGTAVMGILNVTPDSFHDGGRYDDLEDATARAEAMVDAGADIVDVGGESTRPGADPVPVEAEIERVVPVVEALADLPCLVSVDTRKAAVARAALEAGADVLNDVSGLEDPEMRLLAAEYDVPVVVMHSIETPVEPGATVAYDDVVADTLEALAERVRLAETAGLDRSRIIVDPGLGFGKAAAESFDLLGRLEEFRALGCPVLVGHSRKSMFDLVGREASSDRLAATVAATALAADRGADIVRVHDVAENVAAVRTVAAARAGVDATRLDWT